MNFDWDNYCEVAKEIQRTTAGQSGQLKDAFKRTCVSRAYYSIFHHAVNYAVNNMQYPSGKIDSAHLAIKKFYLAQGITVTKYKRVAYWLGALRESRTNCDYIETDLGDLDKLMVSSLDLVQKIKGELV